MKKIFSILIVFSLSLLTACYKDPEIQPRDFPFVITRDAVVNTNGVSFSADIMNIGPDVIIEYGFVWRTLPDPTISDLSIILTATIGKGIYSVSPTSDLVSRQTYYIRAYLKTSKYEVYGNEIIFTAP